MLGRALLIYHSSTLTFQRQVATFHVYNALVTHFDSPNSPAIRLWNGCRAISSTSGAGQDNPYVAGFRFFVVQWGELRRWVSIQVKRPCSKTRDRHHWRNSNMEVGYDIVSACHLHSILHIPAFNIDVLKQYIKNVADCKDLFQDKTEVYILKHSFRMGFLKERGSSEQILQLYSSEMLLTCFNRKLAGVECRRLHTPCSLLWLYYFIGQSGDKAS